MSRLPQATVIIRMKMMTEREKDVVERDGITKEENTMWYEFRLIFLFIYSLSALINFLYFYHSYLYILHSILNNLRIMNI